jgi:hypothetical protein
MDPAKVAGVLEWPVWTTKKEVQSFIGFVNFYRRFIEGFSHLARPLLNLTKNNLVENVVVERGFKGCLQLVSKSKIGKVGVGAVFMARKFLHQSQNLSVFDILMLRIWPRTVSSQLGGR